VNKQEEVELKSWQGLQ